MTEFQLHPQLEKDCFVIGQLPLSTVLMMNDQQFPWFILVPMQKELTEIYQLAANDRQQLLTESCLLAETLQSLYQPDKLNIATIGNIVSQLHVHHIVRYRHDLAWPSPVWGKFPALTYSEVQAEAEISRIRSALGTFLQ